MQEIDTSKLCPTKSPNLDLSLVKMVLSRHGNHCNLHLFQLMLENQSRTRASPLIIKDFNSIKFHSIKSYLLNTEYIR